MSSPFSTTPRSYGFGKTWFDFNGTVGNTYNIISDVDLQVNMYFGGGPFPGQTFVTKVGVRTGGDRLTVSECGYSCLTATVDGYAGGAALAPNTLHTLPSSGTTVRVTPGANSTVEVETVTYRLLLSSPVQDTVWREGVEDTPHLDMAAELLAKPTSPGGILGDTAAYLATGTAGGGHVMRPGGEYVVGDLWATTCDACTYVAATAVRSLAGGLRAASVRLAMAAVRRGGRRVALATAGVSH